VSKTFLFAHPLFIGVVEAFIFWTVAGNRFVDRGFVAAACCADAAEYQSGGAENNLDVHGCVSGVGAHSLRIG
jgi:hypothetical protein